MINLTFSEFYRGEFAEQGYALYVLKDIEGKFMYIGISRNSVWDRWFAGLTSHMERMPSGRLCGNSYIGEVIERRFPDSWNWKIELWTEADCVERLLKEGVTRINGRDARRAGLVEIEAYLIQTYLPFYNVQHAGASHEDPLLKSQLDAAYDKIFNSKKNDK